MLSPSQAVQNAQQTTRNIVGMCDRWVAQYYGYSSSGYATAISHWSAIPANLKHPGDANPPAGALVFWSGGSSGAGHVAISLGGDNIISTDYPRSGITSRTTLGAISNGWGESYLGWSVPVFQGQTANQASYTPGGITNAVQASASSALDFLTGGFGTDIKDLLERAALIILGGILLVLGIVRLSNKSIKSVIQGPVSARKTGKTVATKQAKETSNAVDKTRTEVETEV